jgi:anti-sigma regulatory factor (Ser/Thr protein kinase)
LKLAVRLVNRLSEIEVANRLFDSFARDHGVPVEVIRQFKMAIDELLNNVVSYGFSDGLEHRIDIFAEVENDAVRLTIEDDGEPFDPISAPAPDTGAELKEREIGGLGIHLVREVMSEVEYQRRNDRNIVRLVRRFGDRESKLGVPEREQETSNGDGHL